VVLVDEAEAWRRGGLLRWDEDAWWKGNGLLEMGGGGDGGGWGC
jgi:hypothetical protein